MRISSIEFDRGNVSQNTRGWVCRIWFKVATTDQFTDETHQAFAGSRWWLLAFWKARREAKKLYANIAATPGAREALGWIE